MSGNVTAATGNISITGMPVPIATGWQAITASASWRHGLHRRRRHHHAGRHGDRQRSGWLDGVRRGHQQRRAVITAVDGLISVTGINNSTGTGSGNNGVVVQIGGHDQEHRRRRRYRDRHRRRLGRGRQRLRRELVAPTASNRPAAARSRSPARAATMAARAGPITASNINGALGANGGAILITGTGGNSSGTGNFGINQTGRHHQYRRRQHHPERHRRRHRRQRGWL